MYNSSKEKRMGTSSHLLKNYHSFFLLIICVSSGSPNSGCKCPGPTCFGLYKHFAGIKLTLLFCHLSALSSCPRWKLELSLGPGHIPYLVLLFSRLDNSSVIIICNCLQPGDGCVRVASWKARAFQTLSFPNSFLSLSLPLPSSANSEIREAPAAIGCVVVQPP